LVVPGGVEGEAGEGFSGGGVDDGEVVVMGEDQDAGSVVVVFVGESVELGL